MQFVTQQYLQDLTLCDDLIAYFEGNPNKRLGECSNHKGKEVNKDIKDSIDVELVLEELKNRYCSELQKVVDVYIEEYPYVNYYAAWGIIEPINIQKYNAGGGFKAWHTERAGNKGVPASRHLVFMTYLNDVDDEGETEFFNQKTKIKPRKGLTVIWPADWTFTHRGIPSPSQEKYIITGWFNYLE